MKKAALITALALLLAVMPVPAAAAQPGGRVNVTVAPFAVTLNGMKYDNAYSEYPLLVYRDITYFPMTYFDARWLGLSTFWSAETGLAVDIGEAEPANYHPNTRASKNASYCKATVAASKIAVNGKTVDNASEPYPLLVFREVTYFPLTWRFCVDEFGWSYSWSAKNGLVINAANAVTCAGYTWFLRNDILYRTDAAGREEAVYDAGGRYRIRIRYYENVPDPLVPYLEFANDESPTMATMYRYPLTAAGLGEPETRINWDPAWK